MQRTLLLSSLLCTVGLLACSTVQSSTSPDEPGAPARGSDDTEEDAHAAEDLAQKVSLAEARLDLARMELEALGRKQADRLGRAEAEVELARAKLDNFRDVEGPNSLAQRRLDFQGAQENAAEAAEELAQIRIMYDEQDLDDLTREFVIARGVRRADRAKARIAIQASSLAAFESYELPTQQRKIELELEKAVQALEQAKLEGEIERTNKALSIREAEHELERTRKELAEAQAGAA